MPVQFRTLLRPVHFILRLSLLAVAATLGLASAASGEAWLEVRTEHFTVYTSAGETAGVAAANRLEALHRALSRMAGTPRESALPTKVFLFADDDALQPFKPSMATGRRGSGRAVAGGFFAPRELGNFVAVNARTNQPISSTIQHELLHQFATQNLPRLPFWFNEGLAEYYSTFEVQDGIGIIGRPHQGNLRLLASSPTSTISGRALARVTELRASKELYDDAGDAREAYALSWALVHYLLSDDAHAESTLDFMRGLARGEDPLEAFENAFGREPSAFAGSVVRYLMNGRFPEFQIDLSRAPRPRVRRLSLVEQDLALIELALVVSRPGLAADLLERAWVEAARDDAMSADQEAGLQVAEGQLRMITDDLESALYALREATRLGPGRVEAHLFLARALLARASTMPPGDRDRRALVAEARRAAARAADLAPSLVPALDTLARTWIVEAEHVEAASWPPEDLAQGVRALETALELDRYRSDLATKLAVLHALDEDLDTALGVLQRHRLRYDDDPGWEAAMVQTARIELRLLSMRSAQGGSSRDETERLAERASALMESTYQFDALSHLFADVRTLQDVIQSAVGRSRGGGDGGR